MHIQCQPGTACRQNYFLTLQSLIFQELYLDSNFWCGYFTFTFFRLEIRMRWNSCDATVRKQRRKGGSVTPGREAGQTGMSFDAKLWVL